jgi:hypothetical protein
VRANRERRLSLLSGRELRLDGVTGCGAEQCVPTGLAEPPCALRGCVEGGIAGEVEAAAPAAARERGSRFRRLQRVRCVHGVAL